MPPCLVTGSMIYNATASSSSMRAAKFWRGILETKRMKLIVFCLHPAEVGGRSSATILIGVPTTAFTSKGLNRRVGLDHRFP
jgi:hypothetical protein